MTINKLMILGIILNITIIGTIYLMITPSINTLQNNDLVLYEIGLANNCSALNYSNKYFCTDINSFKYSLKYTNEIGSNICVLDDCYKLTKTTGEQ